MSSLLVSFDVGIKNMAYCAFEISANKVISLADWSLFDLTKGENDSQNETCKCNHILKSKTMKICAKIAKYKKGDVFACESHAKMSKTLKLPTKLFSLPQLKKMPLVSLKALGAENMFVPTDKLNKEKYVLELYEHLQKQHWSSIETKKKTSASKIDLITIGKQLHECILKTPLFNRATHVIIENQISPIANRMKTIQGMLTQEFIMRNCPNVVYVSSSNKLNHFLTKEQMADKKNDYKAHKKDSVEICRNILATRFPEWSHILETHSNKKDDLADSFLQGLWFIETKINE
jgi:hypothetical protein